MKTPKIPTANSEIDEKWLKSVMNIALDKEIQVLAINDIEQKHGFVNGVKTANMMKMLSNYF